MHCSSTAFGDVQVTFPVKGLDMSAYRTVPAAAAGTTSIYDLYAVIQHSGDSVHSGHYTAVAQHPRTRTWHCYNDTRVTQVSLACAMSVGALTGVAHIALYQISGDNIAETVVNGKAYVLFYRRRAASTPIPKTRAWTRGRGPTRSRNAAPVQSVASHNKGRSLAVAVGLGGAFVACV